LVDCEDLYKNTLDSIIHLQKWAQENQWRNTLELAEKETV
jgi:hypothetical protein